MSATCSNVEKKELHVHKIAAKVERIKERMNELRSKVATVTVDFVGDAEAPAPEEKGTDSEFGGVLRDINVDLDHILGAIRYTSNDLDRL